MGHFKLGSEDEYHQVGDIFAPKEIWNDLYPEHHEGLMSLSVRMEPGPRDAPKNSKDHKNISIQPSPKIKFGAYLSYNSHHDISVTDDDSKPAERAAAIIDENWEASWHDAERVFDGVLSQSLGNQK